MTHETTAPPSAEEIQRVQMHLAREECRAYGHDYEHVITCGSRDPKQLFCIRCGRQWPIGEGSGGAG